MGVQHTGRPGVFESPDDPKGKKTVEVDESACDPFFILSLETGDAEQPGRQWVHEVGRCDCTNWRSVGRQPDPFRRTLGHHRTRQLLGAHAAKVRSRSLSSSTVATVLSLIHRHRHSGSNFNFGDSNLMPSINLPLTPKLSAQVCYRLHFGPTRTSTKHFASDLQGGRAAKGQQDAPDPIVQQPARTVLEAERGRRSSHNRQKV